jgi:hypothetical protein
MIRRWQHKLLVAILVATGPVVAGNPTAAEQLKAGDEFRSKLPDIDMKFGKRLFFEIKSIENQPTVGFSDTTVVAATDEQGPHYQYRLEIIGVHPTTGKILKFITEARLDKQLVPTEINVVQSITNDDRTASLITRRSSVNGTEVTMSEEMIDKKRERTLTLPNPGIVIGVEPLFLLQPVTELNEKAFREFLPDRGQTRIIRTEVKESGPDAPAGVAYKLSKMINDTEDRCYLMSADGKVIAVEAPGAGIKMIAADPASIDQLRDKIYAAD